MRTARRRLALRQILLQPWYAVRSGRCYFLMLDSEDDDSEGSPQMNWMTRQIRSLPPEVDYVFVVLHRAPYTSASDAGHRPRAGERDLARALEQFQRASPHPRFVVIAGHVHNYERFQHGGVAYIVSGGGGARPYPLKRTSEDLFRPLSPRELEYHFCLFTVADTLTFQMFHLDDSAAGSFTVRDTFSLSPR
jgi:acid phosphatase type 7